MAVNNRGRKIGEALVNGYKDGQSCPKPVTDVKLNTKNRNIAIKEYDYGPMNPDAPNEDFWQGVADLWGITPEQAKTSRCGNCAAFVQTQKMMQCMRDHIGLDEDYPEEGAEHMANNRARTLEAADLGYCQLFGFKCAADRTCRAWISGGPIK